MNYQGSRDYLNQLSKFGINLGLARIKELLRRAGSPEAGDLKIVHVAGTNGKGSTCAMLYSILQEAGIKTGLFTSPHLYSYRERFSFDGRLISEVQVAELMTRLSVLVEEMREEGFECPTEFEVNTALALLFFQEMGAEWVILEAGMGGSIDSTNAADGVIAIITNVAMDHMQYLGTTIPEIAGAKAGIIKPHALVFTAAEGEALQVIQNVALKRFAELKVVHDDIRYEFCRDDEEGQVFSLDTGKNRYLKLTVPFLGRHQLTNASLAVVAAEAIGVDKTTIRKGLKKAVWPGRLEIIQKEPLVVMDGAHNYNGMEALEQALKLYWPEKRKVALLTMLEDKEREKSLELILPMFDEVIITKPPLAKRAGNWRYLADIAKNNGKTCTLYQNIERAYKKALSLTGQNDLLVVFGSLFLVSEIGKIVKDQAGVTNGGR